VGSDFKTVRSATDPDELRSASHECVRRGADSKCTGTSESHHPTILPRRFDRGPDRAAAPGVQAAARPWFSRPGVASVGQFAVEPELQRNGIGGSLLSFVEDLARQDGVEELSLNTAEPAHHLIAYYEKRGYRVVDTTDATMPNYRSVIMSKRLGPGSRGKQG